MSEKIYRLVTSNTKGYWTNDLHTLKQELQNAIAEEDMDYYNLNDMIFIESLDLYDLDGKYNPEDVTLIHCGYRLVIDTDQDESPRASGYDSDHWYKWIKLTPEEIATENKSYRVF